MARVLQQLHGALDAGDGLVRGVSNGGEVAHLTAAAGAELFVEMQADASDRERGVEAALARGCRPG